VDRKAALKDPKVVDPKAAVLVDKLELQDLLAAQAAA
jgi:hypothetical protein